MWTKAMQAEVTEQIAGGKRSVQAMGRRGRDCYCCGEPVETAAERAEGADGHVAHLACFRALRGDVHKSDKDPDMYDVADEWE